MEKTSKIYVAGHRGLVGSALVRELERRGYTNLLTRTREKLDLRRQKEVDEFFAKERPDYVFLAAAKVGGILANESAPAEFIAENLAIENNVIHNAYVTGVKKLLFLGSSCIYPRLCSQPIKEEYLLSGELEPTNRAYALAKIAGIVACQSYSRQYGVNFISAMPTNLYGQNDNFNLNTSHVLPALIRKFHEAKEGRQASVELWGTGRAEREFLHVDDLAEACIFLMENYDDPEIINIGTGKDLTIGELAKTIQGVVGYDGNIVWNNTKPDGAPKKLLDVGKINSLGWKHRIEIDDGIRMTYKWFKENLGSIARF